MHLKTLHIKNYRCLADVTIPLSSFVCIVGENNTGKSSVLRALMHLIKGEKLEDEDRFVKSDDVVISLEVAGITEDDLTTVTDDDHRERVRQMLHNDTLTLVRRYPAGDSASRLKYLASVPTEERFSDENVKKTFGKKKGQPLLESVRDAFPELPDTLTVDDDLKSAVHTLAQGRALKLEERDLKTGLDASVRALLPEPVYIPAVRELTEDMRTKDAAALGKLLGLLLEGVSPLLKDQQQWAEHLNRAFNVVSDENGVPHDARLEPVKRVEKTIEGLIAEHFSGVRVRLQVPPPDIKTVLGAAQLAVDDGSLGDVSSKGDGLKRAVVFAVIRAYASLRRDPTFAPKDRPRSKIVLLYEEPELYLHPRAQRTLFDALHALSEQHDVLVTTHSPLFFSADETKTFIKMTKKPTDAAPAGHAFPLDLTNATVREQWRRVHFELNNMAFFAKRVVLIEGISDALVLPHLAACLDPNLPTERDGLALCEVGGKGMFKAFREFFQQFDVPVVIIADLDAVLEGFDKLGVGEFVSQRDRLLQLLDQNAGVPKLTSRKIKDIAQRRSTHEVWSGLKASLEALGTGKGTAADVLEIGAELFEVERESVRRATLADQSLGDVLAAKRELLAAMRTRGVFVLERGPIEKYYPSSVSGGDKVAKALDARSKMWTTQEIQGLSETLPAEIDAAMRTELEVVLRGAFVLE